MTEFAAGVAADASPAVTLLLPHRAYADSWAARGTAARWNGWSTR